MSESPVTCKWIRISRLGKANAVLVGGKVDEDELSFRTQRMGRDLEICIKPNPKRNEDLRVGRVGCEKKNIICIYFKKSNQPISSITRERNHWKPKPFPSPSPSPLALYTTRLSTNNTQKSKSQKSNPRYCTSPF